MPVDGQRDLPAAKDMTATAGASPWGDDEPSVAQTLVPVGGQYDVPAARGGSDRRASPRGDGEDASTGP
ncbi:MAG: hypothetical protein QOH50_3662 [Kribbellaceae bacterium]|jgi:hypothetical protein|nr:hypothetical protein [Kribbellaceae bacterium]